MSNYFLFSGKYTILFAFVIKFRIYFLKLNYSYFTFLNNIGNYSLNHVENFTNDFGMIFGLEFTPKYFLFSVQFI